MSFAAYLVGTWEGRFGIGTILQIINPMTYDLEIRVAFLDNNGNFLRCESYELTPNDLEEINVPDLRLTEDHGVVKIISHKDQNVKLGIVGFQRQLLLTAIGRDVEVAFSEAPLAAVPDRDMSIARAELTHISAHCP